MPELPTTEVFLSTTETKDLVYGAQGRGEIRRIGPNLYTRNMVEDVERIVAKNKWLIVALYCPGAIITDRTGFESRPATDGSVFLIHSRSRDVELPGLTIKPRPGASATEEDKPFMNGLILASPERLLLENMKPSRARSGVSRTLSRAEIETRLCAIAARAGDEGANELRRIRSKAEKLAPLLGLQEEMVELGTLIGGLLGTRPDVPLKSNSGRARQAGVPYDTDRLDLLDRLRAELTSVAPLQRRELDLSAVGIENEAFFEAYFSNFIEGTEFEVEEAAKIIFEGEIPEARPEDAHDILGTYKIVSDLDEMRIVPGSAEEFMALLKRRHKIVMEQRPDKRPGQFKHINNRVGDFAFVDRDLVRGTLQEGFSLYRTLDRAFDRAAFMMYLVAIVHPFLDGNGRLARIMMNAELIAAGEQRIIVPTVYRNNYLVALRTLSNDAVPRPLIAVLDFAQKYTGSVPWESFNEAMAVLDLTNAFMRPEIADVEGIRLRLPTEQQLREAEASARSIEEEAEYAKGAAEAIQEGQAVERD